VRIVSPVHQLDDRVSDHLQWLTERLAREVRTSSRASSFRLSR
jgi:diadenosine tetraphosphate (Ap4A) HIT family hydrolase